MSLWKGTMHSHGAGWDEVAAGMVLNLQASPMGWPSMTVREAGQIGARPSMSTFQRVVRGTMGTEEAWVDGCEMR